VGDFDHKAQICAYQSLCRFDVSGAMVGLRKVKFFLFGQKVEFPYLGNVKRQVVR
jgi:hypothetical protein